MSGVTHADPAAAPQSEELKMEGTEVKADDPVQTAARLEKELVVLKERLESLPDCKRLKYQIAVMLVDLGTNLRFSGRSEEGVKRYVESLEYNAMYPSSHYNLGVAAGEGGRYEEALQHYEKALEINPCCIEALCNVGLIKRQQGDLEAACAYYERALRARPYVKVLAVNYAVALSDLGARKQQAGDPRGASVLYEKALLYHPFYPDAYYNLGVAWSCRTDEELSLEKALYYYQMAVHFKPEYAEAWNNLGVAYSRKGTIDLAVECYQKALALATDQRAAGGPGLDTSGGMAQTMNNLAVLLGLQGELSKAQELLRSCVALQPTNAEAYNNLGVVLRDEGVMEEALQCYEKCLALCPEAENAAQNRLLALNFSTTHPLDNIQQAHMDWGARIMATHAPKTPLQWLTDMDPERKKLRVGYVSPDFYLHSVSYFAHNVLKHHNPDEVEVYCFANVMKPDSKTFAFQQLVPPERWVDIVGKNMDEAAEIILSHKIDILVDLTGHTSTNRLDIFVKKPAPVQVTWIGYPNSTGLPTIDYRLTDAKADPWDVAKPKHYSETLYRLPGSFLCYCPDTPDPEQDEKGEIPSYQTPEELLKAKKEYAVNYRGDVKPAIPKTTACATKGYVTFGTFNNMAKINMNVVRVWAEIMKRLPTSRLMCKSKPFSEPRIRNMFLGYFEKHGIDKSRITLIGIIPQHYNHLQAYENIDVGLDCWPYAGTTTTCEALWMGVPTVTMTGPHHAANVGASLLESVGAPELIASTEEEYIDIAVKLADPARLLKYRTELQDNMKKSILCDGPVFMKNVEAAYREFWAAACRGEKHVQQPPDAAGTAA
eukprot:TRINITY_DN5104_c0_g1_i3.p1 TRINITY_DN5104_c0_g1~~TRINITY_DN5104_c0_g1_i3.p1  ORF type:complete len:828 (+),score=337.50 TRINITY_DN5104_c0_g1_i3:84-2567(+)